MGVLRHYPTKIPVFLEMNRHSLDTNQQWFDLFLPMEIDQISKYLYIYKWTFIWNSESLLQ